MRHVTDRAPFHEVYNCKRPEGLKDKDRAILHTDITNVVARATALGVPLDHLAFDLPDEPGPRNAKANGEMRRKSPPADVARVITKCRKSTFRDHSGLIFGTE